MLTLKSTPDGEGAQTLLFCQQKNANNDEARLNITIGKVFEDARDRANWSVRENWYEMKLSRYRRQPFHNL